MFLIGLYLYVVVSNNNNISFIIVYYYVYMGAQPITYVNMSGCVNIYMC